MGGDTLLSLVFFRVAWSLIKAQFHSLDQMLSILSIFHSGFEEVFFQEKSVPPFRVGVLFRMHPIAILHLTIIALLMKGKFKSINRRPSQKAQHLVVSACCLEKGQYRLIGQLTVSWIKLLGRSVDCKFRTC
jgi:hypothetical protein